ncbi:hypothetical protein V6N13_050893 [Hibiscus sabdariffa]|uniref:Uncharacterized protein n=1 Tax=Hibiscus sabdariffa TaxID=183260 RepID=A0ABR2PIN2_9ROSI
MGSFLLTSELREIDATTPEFHARFSAKSKLASSYHGFTSSFKPVRFNITYEALKLTLLLVALLLQIDVKYALSAPPHRLCLVSVKYNEEHLRLPSECPTTSFGRYHTISKCKLPFY